MQIYTALGIQKKEIDKRQSWQNLIETAFTLLEITCAGYLGHPFGKSGLLCMMEQAFLRK
jgi:hypothetical protein